MKKFLSTLACISIFSTLAFTGCTSDNTYEDTNVLNIYSARHYDEDNILFEKFTEETGIQVNVIEGNSGELLERLRVEGENTQADLFMTVDGGVLDNARTLGLLQPVESSILDENVPNNLRDRDNYWYAMSYRARVIVYSLDRVDPSELSTYEALTGDEWEGRVLLRSSTSLYNQSLLASFIDIYGEEYAEDWARGMVNNMARSPQGNDRDQASAIVAGEGDVTLINTYYLGLMLNSTNPEEVRVAQNVGVFYPNQETTGTHINVSGMGVTKHATNVDNAIKFMEFITDVEQQEFITNTLFDFPVNPNARKAPLLETFGEFNTQEIDFSSLATNNITAVEILNRVGWN